MRNQYTKERWKNRDQDLNRRLKIQQKQYRRVKTHIDEDLEDYWDGKTLLEEINKPCGISGPFTPSFNMLSQSDQDKTDASPLIPVPDASVLPKDFDLGKTKTSSWVKLLDLLYDLALSVDGLWDKAVSRSTDVQHFALHNVFAIQVKENL